MTSDTAQCRGKEWLSERIFSLPKIGATMVRLFKQPMPIFQAWRWVVLILQSDRGVGVLRTPNSTHFQEINLKVYRVMSMIIEFKLTPTHCEKPAI